MTYLQEPPRSPSAHESLKKISNDSNARVELATLKERFEVQAARLRMVEKMFEGRIEEQRLTNATLFNYISEMRATIPHMERLMDRLIIQEKRLDGLYEINTSILTQIKELEEKFFVDSESKEEPLFNIPVPVTLFRDDVTHVTESEKI